MSSSFLNSGFNNFLNWLASKSINPLSTTLFFTTSGFSALSFLASSNMSFLKAFCINVVQFIGASFPVSCDFIFNNLPVATSTINPLSSKTKPLGSSTAVPILFLIASPMLSPLLWNAWFKDFPFIFSLRRAIAIVT